MRLCALRRPYKLCCWGMIGWWQARLEPLLIGFALAVLLRRYPCTLRRLDCRFWPCCYFGLSHWSSAGVFFKVADGA